MARGDPTHGYDLAALTRDPAEDVDRLTGEALLRFLAREQLRTNRLLIELVHTTRFSRGGYDGPFTARRTFAVPGPSGSTNPILLVKGRDYPCAVVLRWVAVLGGGFVNVTPDRGDPLGGIVLDFTVNGTERIIVDRHQDMWAVATVATNPVVVVQEARL